MNAPLWFLLGLATMCAVAAALLPRFTAAADRRSVLRSCAEQRAARAADLGLINPADVPGQRRRSPDVGLVRPDAYVPRVLDHMPRQH